MEQANFCSFFYLISVIFVMEVKNEISCILYSFLQRNLFVNGPEYLSVHFVFLFCIFTCK